MPADGEPGGCRQFCHACVNRKSVLTYHSADHRAVRNVRNLLKAWPQASVLTKNDFTNAPSSTIVDFASHLAPAGLDLQRECKPRVHRVRPLCHGASGHEYFACCGDVVVNDTCARICRNQHCTQDLTHAGLQGRTKVITKIMSCVLSRRYSFKPQASTRQ